MDKQNEHQPLDDLFRRKLSKATVQPGTESWTRLQGRLTGQPLPAAAQPNRRIGAVWYWSASAAACLLLTFLWANQYSKPTYETGKPDLAATTKTSVESTPPLRQIETSVVAENELGKLTKPSIDNAESISNPQNKETVKTPNRLYANGPNTLESQQKIDVKQPELIVKTTDKQLNKTPDRLESPEWKATVAINNGDPATKPTPQNTDRTLIVSVAEPVSELLPTKTVTPQSENSVVPQELPVKNARIARVFRQIKRLKDGEALAKADINPGEPDEEIGIFNRLIQVTRSKENQSKQQK